jgi:hypothetical protein
MADMDASELVGAQKSSHHVDADADRRCGVNQGHDHAQSLFNKPA